MKGLRLQAIARDLRKRFFCGQNRDASASPDDAARRVGDQEPRPSWMALERRGVGRPGARGEQRDLLWALHLPSKPCRAGVRQPDRRRREFFPG
jgi:hypothetical protein